MAYWNKPSYAGKPVTVTKKRNIVSTTTLLNKTSSLANYFDYQLGNIKNYLVSAKADLSKENLNVNDKSFELYFDKLIQALNLAATVIDQAINSFETNCKNFADVTEKSYDNYLQYLRDKASEQEIQYHYDLGNIG